MKMKILIVLALALCAYATEVAEKKKTEDKPAEDKTAGKDKRQTQHEVQPGDVYYRQARKQEPIAPVEEPIEDDKPIYSRSDEEYRPGQVFSLNVQELLDLQPERKAPLPSGQQLQQLYSNPQQEHKQNLQQIYYLDPEVSRQQLALPSHAVIARPSYTSNGGEASVGAALSVSDTGATSSEPFDHDLYTLLGQPQVRQQEEPRTPAYQTQQPVTQSIAAQYQQIDRYLTKPAKKPTQKIRSKVQITPPQSAVAPQQYLIETTNLQQQPQQQQQVQQQVQQQLHQQLQQQYRQAPQPQRAVQLLRYVPIQPTQQVIYESPEPQGIKVVPAPKLSQPHTQPSFRLYQHQYQQAEATPKQYRIVEAPRLQPIRQEPRISAPSIERPVTYLKRFPDVEKQRAVKIYEQMVSEPAQQQQQHQSHQQQQQQQHQSHQQQQHQSHQQQQHQSQQQLQQIAGEQQYYLRPVYRINDQRARYEFSSIPLRSAEPSKVVESTKPPSSSIYVSKNIAPKKVRPQVQSVKNQEPLRETYRLDQSLNYEPANVEQSSQYSNEQRVQLPPPKNNKAYTPEEFAALVAAGFSVTPIPVGSISRSGSEPQPAPVQPRRILPSRRNQYLPLRSDEAP